MSKTIINLNAGGAIGEVRAISIVPGTLVSEQIENQLRSFRPERGAELVLHAKPEVGAAVVWAFNGLHNRYPVVHFTDRSGKSVGVIDLDDFRHNVCRPLRSEVFDGADFVAPGSAIVINPTGRGLTDGQRTDLRRLIGTDDLVEVNFSLGQSGVDYEWGQVGSEVLTRLLAALSASNVGKSLADASHPLVCLTLGLSPLNAAVMVAVNALAERVAVQPVAGGAPIFPFLELIDLAQAETIGRQTVAEIAAGNAPVLVLRGEIATRTQAMAEALRTGDETEIRHQLNVALAWLDSF